MKINISELPHLPNSAPCSLVSLRASDNTRHFRHFKGLVRGGAELHGIIENRDNYPTLTIVVDGRAARHPVWLFPKAEQFALRYLLTGDNRGFPKYPRNNDLPDTQADDNYIDRHIKRELARGNYIHDIEERNGITGIRFKAIYPYGSIDYGFHPYSWEEFTTRLERFILKTIRQNNLSQ